MNKNECLVADWQAIGHLQGANGGGVSKFDAYQKACAKHNIRADFNAFKQGHNQGVKSYCTFEQGLISGKNGEPTTRLCSYKKFPEFTEGYASGIRQYCSYAKGYTLGAENKSTPTACSDNQYPDFMKGYNDGLEEYRISQSISALIDDLENLDEEIAEITANIKTHEATLVSPISTVPNRKIALKHSKQLKQKRRELTRQHRHLEQELNDLQNTFDRMYSPN